ncbi:MAG: putative bifunctional diguanylate cyclase/phosphodiesterase [Acidimicrobiales bacterium]
MPPRRPHRVAQPLEFQRARRRAPRCRRRAAHRSRPLQGGQRHPRARPRRSPAAQRGRPHRKRGHRGRDRRRLGGDEFGVLLPDAHASDAAQMAVSLLGALEQPFHLDGLMLELTASIGVALKASSGEDAGKLLQQADVAMYSAKSAHSGWEMYSADRDHHGPQRLAMAGELRRAIDDGQLEVHYQPKADMRTGMVVSLEALVRWRHPRYGLIGPDQFIPVAERTGLIRPLTLLVLDGAGRLHAQLRQTGRPLGVAVNLSVRSVVDVNLPDQVADVLARYEMEPQSLTLEITEGSVMSDPARAIGILGRLVALGTQLSIDDFGTGYSSLAYLKRLPASEVKVDRTFISGLLNDRSDSAIVRSTVDLARNLGLRSVAEGVEDGQTWSRLIALGCDQAQGYFISPALPVPDLHRWLARTRTRIVGDQTL